MPDLTGLRPWLTLTHVLAAFAFVFIHGASAMVAFKLRRERDRVRIQALLELSNAYLNALYLALLVLLAAGIGSGIVGGYWTSGRLWIWASVGIFIGIALVMYLVPTPHFDVLRHALGMPTFNDTRKKLEPPPPASDEELARLLASPKPIIGAVIGFIGIGLLVWLMMFKPF